MKLNPLTFVDEIVWKAVASETAVMDGVKAVSPRNFRFSRRNPGRAAFADLFALQMSIGKSRTATMEPDLEWFVSPTSDGLFEITLARLSPPALAFSSLSR